MRHSRCGGVALRLRILLRLRIPAAAAGATVALPEVAVLGMCARAARGTPPLLPFFVVNAATFGRVNAYARRSLVQLKLVAGLRFWLPSVLQDASYDFSLAIFAVIRCEEDQN